MRSAGVLFAMVGAALAGGAARLAQIQYCRGADLQERARRQQTAVLTIPALRGDIVDTKGRLLAGSDRRASIFADPTLLLQERDRHYAAYSVASVLGLDPRELLRLLNERADCQFVWVKRRVEDREAATFNELREARRLYAFGVQHEAARTYPHGRLAAHVLGFVGDPQDGVPRGLAGVELVCEEYLRGRQGQRSATVDVRRRRLRTHVCDYVPPRDGATVVLTIDAYVQEQTELHLRRAVEDFRAEWGTAVVIDPQSGEILAMASVPDFDPAQPIPPGTNEDKARERLRNRAIADAFEPGSVFKPFIAAWALEERLVRLDEVFQIGGPARNFGGRTLHDTHAYGALPVHEIISRSSNIGMALVGERCGNERLYRYVRSYGFGEPTGVGLPGEHAGLVRDLKEWGRYSTHSVPIGQEVGVTALQIAVAFSVLANDGVLYRPRIVRGVIAPDGEVIWDNSAPQPVRRVLSARTVARFREEALVEVVMSKFGTGKAAQIANYRVFGKTGTAQVAGRRGYVPGAYVGTFVGGAPADHPRAVAVVSLYRPSAGKYYGGTIAAPAVGAILADTLAYMRVPPEVTAVSSE